ncbi:transposase [Cylindrospermopsis raciborskii CHAB3438]|uniref:transposase n=1 Tax=Cylindrospermopsis raciborskii TaxID=77022 RepID=UPI001F1148AA|nr:transposase [Cylindrospermopsis raciborskii]MCH4903871.1 transposase [Cylindrospermopsis raciborskii CHAB3438]
MSEIAIIEAFTDLPDPRRTAGQRHEKALCLDLIEVETETRYYIASFIDTADTFAQKIRSYWDVENKVHYIRDVTQGEDHSRTRTNGLVQIFAIARNLALNLYRSHDFKNMAQAQRFASFGLTTLKQLFSI